MVEQLAMLKSIYVINQGDTIMGDSVDEIMEQLKISLGRIDGLTVVNVAGINLDIDIGTEDVWTVGGTYVFPSNTGEALYCSSSDNADTVDIRVHGLDGDWADQTVIQTLAGRTKTRVGTTETFSRICCVEVNEAVDVPAGTVYIYRDNTVTAGVPDDITKNAAQILPPYNRSMQAIYSVPAGHITLVKYPAVSSNNRGGGILSAALDGEVIKAIGAGDVQAEHFSAFPEKTDFKMSFTAIVDNCRVTASFKLYLVERVRFEGLY